MIIPIISVKNFKICNAWVWISHTSTYRTAAAWCT